MHRVVQFMRSLVMVALLLGAAGILVEAAGIAGREAANAYQRGGIKFKWTLPSVPQAWKIKTTKPLNFLFFENIHAGFFKKKSACQKVLR